MAVRPDLAELWTFFADRSCGAYSPLYDRICRTVASSDDVLELIDEAPSKGHLPNVLLAAVHYLLLGGDEHPLAAVYAGTSDADVGPLFVDFCLAHRADVLELLATRHTNTNEVGRSALLGCAFTTVARRLGGPLGLVDVGCSAGLNLLCDRYLLDYGSAGSTGPEGAVVRVDCDVIGGSAPVAPRLPEIVARVGIDRHPVEATDEDESRWLLACVWPDTGRLPRMRAALEEARRTPPDLVRGDAVEAVTDVVLGLPAGALATVTTTWSLAYLSEANRVLFRDTLLAASQQRPIAWISGDGAGVVELFGDIDAPTDEQGNEGSVLGLVVLRDGDLDAEVLAFVHSHGTWIDWRAPLDR